MHDLDVPKIGYIHTWTSTQDEGWVRMALDKFKVPYTYFADNLVRQGNLKQKYDVIIFPHAGGTGNGLVYGGVQGNEPRPYKKTDETPHLGIQDSTDDMRGGLGYDGLQELMKFVQAGGVLITEGGTSTIFPEFNLTQGITIEQGEGLNARGSVLKTVLGDRRSPVLYGYDQNALAVYFNQGPIFSVGRRRRRLRPRRWRRARRRRGGPQGNFGNMQPNAMPAKLTTLDGGAYVPPVTPAEPAAAADAARRAWPRRARRRRAAAASADAAAAAQRVNAPRVLLSFPTDPNDLLLSGLLVGGDAIAGRAVAIDAPIGKGHVVMFANRPFWRWQTQGNFFLGFNTILNWNDLDAGRTAPATTTAQQR